MVLSQSYSFSSWQQDALSSLQLEQNSVSDKESGVRRVTISQLLKATPTDDSPKRFQINGVNIKRVILVANVLDERLVSTRKSYNFDDSTGQIKGTAWEIESDFTFEPFAYARVVGELDQYHGFYSLKVLNIQPIYDPYEIYYHIGKAIHETLELEGGSPPGDFQQGGETDHSIQNHDMESLSQAFQHNVSISTATTKSTSRGNKRRPRSKLERDLVKIVFALSDDDDDAEGVLINDIAAELRAADSTIGSQEIWEAVEYLLEEDFIATYDDHHYQPGARYRSTS